MKSNTAQTKPAAHKMNIVEVEIDRDRAHTERLMDLAAKRYYADVRAGAAKARALKEGREFFLTDDNRVSRQTPTSPAASPAPRPTTANVA